MSDSSPKHRSCCPVSCALDLVGDKWTLVIIRDALLGAKRFKDFSSSPEKIPTNILSDRLEKLEAYGILEKRPIREGIRRYEYYLTKKGKELKTVMLPLAKWGLKNIEGTAMKRDPLG